MFSLRLRTAALTALTLAVLPAALAAQQAQPPAQGAAPSQEEVRGWLTELQQVHGQLESIQQKALQDPALSTAQQELGNSIKSAMEKLDPSLETTMARVQALETEAAAAQESGDQARLQELGAEAQQIQQQFMTVQQQALQQPELATRVEAFQELLEEKMRTVDPQADQLISRFQELQRKVAVAMQGAAPGR